MKKTILILLLLSFLGCNKKRENKFYIDRINMGMSAKEVVNILGTPIDSFQYYNHEKKLILKYRYKEENFSDYSFYVTFSDSLIVVDYDYH